MTESSTAHLSAETNLIPAIKAWEFYLNDQGRSPNTIKAHIYNIEGKFKLPSRRSLVALAPAILAATSPLPRTRMTCPSCGREIWLSLATTLNPRGADK